MVNLEKLLDHLKMHKVVRLDEVAAYFRTTTAVIAAKIASLQQEGQLQGITDDFGKYIFLESCQLTNLQDFIITKGRLSLQSLLTEANREINLNVSAQDIST